MASSKNSRGYREAEVSPTKRFRANVTDLFLSGGASGERSHSLLVDGQLAGAKNVSDLAKPSADDNRYGCTDDSSDSEVRYHQWFVDTLAEKAIDSKDDHSHILLRTWNSPEKAIDSKEDHSQTATRPERQGLNRA